MISLMRLGPFCLLALCAAPVALAQTEAPQWCEFAQEYLSQRNGKPFDCTKAGRCIKLNNYGCSQNHTAKPYPGQMMVAGKPVTDPQKHVLYEHPKWSLSKTIRTLLNYHKDGRDTAIAIAERYSPWCDTLGSKKLNGRWGRTCMDRLEHVSATYSPRCTKVEKPGREQCQHCNCPNNIAEFYVKGQGITYKDPIGLFDDKNKPTQAMLKFLIQVSTLETGYVPSEKLVNEAIASFMP